MTRATAFTLGLIRDSASRLKQFGSNLLDAVDTIVDDHPAHDCTECQLTWRVAQLERELLIRETVAAAVQKLGGRVEWDVCPKETIARISALIDDDEYEQAATELAKAKETAPTDTELVRLQTMIDFMNWQMEPKPSNRLYEIWWGPNDVPEDVAKACAIIDFQKLRRKMSW